ncbi:Rossmann-like domain-containing protein [Chloroflexota bacterium]
MLTPLSILNEAKEKLSALVKEHHLGSEAVQVTVRALSPEQAIGKPQRRDFPLLEGKEVIVEAEVKGSRGQAFTDKPHNFAGSVADALELGWEIPGNRAIFLSTLNAITACLGIATGVRHCRDDEPEKCGEHITHDILKRFGKTRVGLIGFQPAILENLTKRLGSQNVRSTDLNSANIGSYKYGIEIWDGKADTQQLIDWCQVVLVTSSTMANNTFDNIYQTATTLGKRFIIFGVTGAGVCALTSLERICPFSH